MLSNLVGAVDAYSAAVLIAISVTLCIVVTTMVGKRRSKRELEMQFEIDKEKLANENRENERSANIAHEFNMAKLSTEKDVAFKRIERGVIEVEKN